MPGLDVVVQDIQLPSLTRGFVTKTTFTFSNPFYFVSLPPIGTTSVFLGANQNRLGRLDIANFTLTHDLVQTSTITATLVTQDIGGIFTAGTGILGGLINPLNGLQISGPFQVYNSSLVADLTQELWLRLSISGTLATRLTNINFFSALLGALFPFRI